MTPRSAITLMVKRRSVLLLARADAPRRGETEYAVYLPISGDDFLGWCRWRALWSRRPEASFF